MPGWPLAFGPVYSRRLGWSLGVNPVPPKACTWRCVYCYLGCVEPVAVRRVWVETGRVVEAVVEAASRARRVDYATLIGVGEPTLAANIGEIVEALKGLGFRVAVFSNGSLYSRGVAFEVAEADYVKATVTTWDEEKWRMLHRPAAPGSLEEHLEGVYAAGREARSGVHVEVMLVKGVNDSPFDAEMLGDMLRGVRLAAVYVNAPTSPPCEPWVEPPPPETLARFASILSSKLPGVPVEPIAYRPRRPPQLDPRNPLQSLAEIVSTHILTREEALEALRGVGVEDPEGVLREALGEGLLREEVIHGKAYIVAGGKSLEASG